MRITSPKRHWTGVGRMAARMRMTLASALTNNDTKIDAWIKAGFDSMTRKINKREREALGDGDTMALVKEKLGF